MVSVERYEADLRLGAIEDLAQMVTASEGQDRVSSSVTDENGHTSEAAEEGSPFALTDHAPRKREDGTRRLIAMQGHVDGEHRPLTEAADGNA